MLSLCLEPASLFGGKHHTRHSGRGHDIAQRHAPSTYRLDGEGYMDIDDAMQSSYLAIAVTTVLSMTLPVAGTTFACRCKRKARRGSDA
jgi:hypothetical protein